MLCFFLCLPFNSDLLPKTLHPGLVRHSAGKGTCYAPCTLCSLHATLTADLSSISGSHSGKREASPESHPLTSTGKLRHSGPSKWNTCEDLCFILHVKDQLFYADLGSSYLEMGQFCYSYLSMSFFTLIYVQGKAVQQQPSHPVH